MNSAPLNLADTFTPDQDHLIADGVTDSEYADTSAEPDGVYYYKVTGVTSYGDESAASDVSDERVKRGGEEKGSSANFTPSPFIPCPPDGPIPHRFAGKATLIASTDGAHRRSHC